MRERFFFSLARISAIQILRSAGITRAKPIVTDSFTDIFIRPLVQMEDLRAAMENIGLLGVSSTEDDVEPIEIFLNWCKGSFAAELRQLSGQECKPDSLSIGWLDKLMQKHIKEKFHGTVLDSNVETPVPRLADPRITNLSPLHEKIETMLKK
ncbi:hypothetical protein MERGE_000203 [Pneumocystis wakefieldiae]|uniref:Uncharacterized protein n=1 Tax=Pneumocystis wakefieldiae TaxID=38082 RepID=A0A899FY28_9ASCO|nr:hypothetical protein MERGE_000203 [Pneumocystis wakefieldiae]